MRAIRTLSRLLPLALLPVSLLGIIAVSTTGCSRAAIDAAPAAQWSCSPDAESRYHIGPDGMTLEVCSAGCADQAEGAICGG